MDEIDINAGDANGFAVPAEIRTVRLENERSTAVVYFYAEDRYISLNGFGNTEVIIQPVCVLRRDGIG